MDKYFDYKKVANEKKVKFAFNRLKGHAYIWWDSVKEKKGTKVRRRLLIGTRWWEN